MAADLGLRIADWPLVSGAEMKTKISAIILAAAAMLTTACEQHKWDETKQLFQEGEHGAKAEHGEKKIEEAKH